MGEIVRTERAALVDDEAAGQADLSQSRLTLTWLSSGPALSASAGAGIAILLTARAVLPISWACVAAMAVMWTVAGVFALLQPRAVRIVCLNLFAFSFAINALALLALTVWSTRSGGPFLGPDSSMFLRGAKDLAQRAFHLHTGAEAFFGTYNVSQFYLFGAAIRWLHADLFALQTLNVGFVALVAPLTFAVARHVARPFERIAALVAALNPSIVVLAAVDLLKDPSIIAATLAALWAVFEVVRSPRLRQAVAIAALSVVPLLYLRTGRFFVFTYLEAAAAVAGLWVLIRCRRVPVQSAIRAGVLAGAFLAAEAIPFYGGWPLSAGIFVLEARVATSPDLQLARQLPANASGVWSVSEAPVLRVASAESDFSLHTTLIEEARSRFGAPAAHALSLVLNVGRRFLGPFPWVAPKRLDLAYLQANAFLMYPGVLCWYALLPLIVAGWLSVTRRLGQYATASFDLAFLWIFTAIYVAPYVLLDFNYLPYRQRDAIIPILVVVGFAGAGRSNVRLKYWYAALTVLLAAVAVFHVVARGWLGG